MQKIKVVDILKVYYIIILASQVRDAVTQESGSYRGVAQLGWKPYGFGE